jgi:protein O-mannosyl-transferase
MSKKKNTPVQNAPSRGSETKLEPKIAPKPAAPLKDLAPAKPLNNRLINIICTAVIGLVSFAIFSNSIKNRFVLDDHGIIKSNKITKAGLSKDNLKKIFTTSHRAGDVSELEHSLYRPVVKAIFAGIWQYSGGKDNNYETFHFFNVLCYALLCMVLYWVLLYVFKQNWALAVLASFLFLTHPLHSEVVANNKSLDEILGLLGPLAAILIYAQSVRTTNFGLKILYLILGAIFYLFGLLSKESAMLCIPLIPAFAWYFNKASLKDVIFISVSALIALIIWYVLRDRAIGWFLADQSKKPDPSALDNVLSLCKFDQSKKGNFDMSKAIPTVLFIMGRYVWFCFAPDKLSCDYSYASIEPKTFGDPYVLLSLVFFIGIIFFAFKSFMKKGAIGYGIFWFLITSFIASNITVVVGYIIGTSFGDRMMFTPSMGWAIVVVGALYAVFGYAKKELEDVNFKPSLLKLAPIAAIVALASMYYTVKARERNADWERDYTLFAKDVENYPNSTHLLFYWGNHLSSNEYMEGKSEDDKKMASRKALETFERSMKMYPALPSDGYNQYGKCYYNLGNVDSAEKYYLKAHKEDSTNSVFMNNIGTIYFQRANALTAYVTNPAAPANGGVASILANIPRDPMVINQKRMSLYDSAMRYFNMAYVKDTTVIDYQNNLGAVYGTVQQFDKAIYWFSRGYKSDSLSEGAILSCRSNAVTYKTLNNPQLEQYWMQKAAEVQKYRNERLASM